MGRGADITLEMAACPFSQSIERKGEESQHHSQKESIVLVINHHDKEGEEKDQSIIKENHLFLL